MEQKRPNIVVFMLDSLRPDHLGCNGCKVAKTPNIDQLADHTNFVCCFQLGSPESIQRIVNRFISKKGENENISDYTNPDLFKQLAVVV